jgi:MscS family membrane protein
MIDVLNEIFYGNTIKDIGISLLIIVGAFILNKILLFIYNKVIKKITSKSPTRLDDVFFAALEKPLFMGIILLAIWIAVGRLEIRSEVFNVISKSYDILVIVVVTWFFSRYFNFLLEDGINSQRNNTVKGGYKIDPKLLPLIKRILSILIWTIGGITVLHNLGLKVTTLMGTLGIGGIAFALAAQDTIKNIFGGITIFTDRPFRIGDIIKFDQTEGTVVDIGLRSTRICMIDTRITTIPNYKLTDALITNISSESGRRITLDLGLTYDTTFEKMQEALSILKDMPNRVSGVNQNATVFFSTFGDSALVVSFIYFISKSYDIAQTRSNVNFEILRSFTDAGIDFAFPTQTLHIDKTIPSRI